MKNNSDQQVINETYQLGVITTEGDSLTERWERERRGEKREREYIDNDIWEIKLIRQGNILNVNCQGENIIKDDPGLVQRKMCLILHKLRLKWTWTSEDVWPLTILRIASLSSWLTLINDGVPRTQHYSSLCAFQSVILSITWLRRLMTYWVCTSTRIIPLIPILIYLLSTW